MSLRQTIHLAPVRSAGLIGAAALTLAAGAAVTARAADYQPSVLYTESDATAVQGGNAILAFHAQGDDVIPFATFATGGDGTGTALGSQGALALADSDTGCSPSTPTPTAYPPSRSSRTAISGCSTPRRRAGPTRSA